MPGAIAAPPVAVADPHKGRRVAGLVLWILGVLGGIGLNALFQFITIVTDRRPDDVLTAMVVGALFALPPLAIYLFVPWIIDRYDPEPWWSLAMAFLWGAFAATGGALVINSLVDGIFGSMFGPAAGNFMAACVSAPLCEEFFKGMAVLGFFYFLRKEFDGIVDAIIYATFCALGFAAIENVLYYKHAALKGGDQLLYGTFFLRGVLTPWLHPLFTSMTGIGFGIARETTKTWLKVMAPMFGYAFAVFLHATWNFVATVIPPAAILMLPVWILFNIGFFVFIVILVIRKGRVIRDNLKDEVLIGNLTQEEVDLITSPVGRIRATFSWRGSAGRAFIKAGARLALSKWHTARAMKGQKRTISADFIVPLRQELMALRHQMMQRAPR
jgi:RsiW-degrading membrane proteinase PrsW (M82 family)